MPNNCQSCSVFRAEMQSCRVETNAIREDRAARVSSASSPTNGVALFRQAMERWRTAVQEYEAHRSSHLFGAAKVPSRPRSHGL